MSGFQQKNGTGALFWNEDKEQPTHADWKGTITIDGKEYWLNAWKNVAKSSGKEYLGVTVKPKQAKGAQQSPQRAAPESQQKSQDLDFDDDIPF